MTWQGQFCPFVKKIKINICVFPKAFFPHLSSGVVGYMRFFESFFSPFTERCWVLGDSCAFNSVGDCAFNLGWHLVCVGFGGFFGG